MADAKQRYRWGYEPREDADYQKALGALESARQQKPVY